MDLALIAEAIDVLRQADGERPLDPRSPAQLAGLRFGQGDSAAARVELERVVASGVRVPGAENDLAWLLAASGESLERAQTLAAQAAAAQADEHRFVHTGGYVLLRRGLASAAREQFELALQVAEAQGQEPPAYHFHRGLALRMGRQNRQAMKAFERALALDPPPALAEQARRHLAAAGKGEPLSADQL